MGWLYRDEPIDDPLAYLKTKYNYDCETHTLQTLDGACVRNTVYLAVRSTDKKTGRSLVLAAVILISNTKKHGFGYKDMDEVDGAVRMRLPPAHYPPAVSDRRSSTSRLCSRLARTRCFPPRAAAPAPAATQIAQRRQHRQTAGCHALFRRDYRQRVPCRSCPTRKRRFSKLSTGQEFTTAFEAQRSQTQPSPAHPIPTFSSAAKLSVRNRNQN